MRRWIVLAAVPILLAAPSACTGHHARSANAICDDAVPHWVTAAPTSVAYIRHFKTGDFQVVSPFADAFGAAPDRAPAAWCWVQRGPRTFRGYAATSGQKPLMIAEISGSFDKPPRGAPTIL